MMETSRRTLLWRRVAGLLLLWQATEAFVVNQRQAAPASYLSATVAPEDIIKPECALIPEIVLDSWDAQKAQEWDDMYGAESAGFYALVKALRDSQIAMGLSGLPFVLRRTQIEEAGFAGFFDMQDLEKALADDFLDAARGSTDNRKGWKVRQQISVPERKILVLTLYE